MTRLLLLVIVITTFSGCARPGDHPISPNCEWIESEHRTLNLAVSADHLHIRSLAPLLQDACNSTYVNHPALPRSVLYLATPSLGCTYVMLLCTHERASYL